ncbi:BZ3500_MvSof-1268-A1-R1_Chr11-1g03244 [Microbotryum saponariae]|uniref:Replication factor C subunit 5 n=1 Tax=Microbotryum saponariae TaxID=289078 RepID=A0A2X0LAB4_9BASI|nr:BZ3501_MvSof-1269-A2-R1_Chr11g02819 [Microbotryum saponariae]SDA03804.1 BZ3500_MvSof-1268-A1-R1_Chr11-1g03244 [Microbotryum saponariae]
MSLLVDKHRPKSLDELQYHAQLSDRLRSLAQTDFPHTLFYGPSGAGKKTRIMCCLRELYGPGVEKLRIEQRTFLTPSKRKIEINIVQSNYHIELTPSDAGNYDRSIIQEILKDIAQTQQVDLNAKKRFKVVIINEADSLSRDAQSALRRTMEKFTANLRIILCANSTSRIIGPIRSRCLLLRVGAPSEDEITKCLAYAAKKEKFTLPAHVSTLLARISEGNLRRALLSLEALYVQDPSFKTISPSHPLLKGQTPRLEDLDSVPRPDWEKYTAKAAERILGEQTPERLLEVRGMLYELLVHCIPAPLIISTLTRRILERVDEPLKADVVYWAAFYEHRLRLGSKAIFHLEAFCAKIMSVYKRESSG